MTTPGPITASGCTRAVGATCAEGSIGMLWIHEASGSQENDEQCDPQRSQKVPVESYGIYGFTAGPAQHHDEQRDQSANQVRGMKTGEHVEKRAVGILRQIVPAVNQVQPRR